MPEKTSVEKKKKKETKTKKSETTTKKKSPSTKTTSNEIQKGDFLLVDLVGHLKETKELIDVTIEEVAKAEKVYDEKTVYKPRLVVVGDKWVVDGLDEELLKMKVGEEKEVEIPPEKGFGQRDPNAIKVLPLREFRKQKIKPYPGMRLRLGGAYAVVKSVSSGRVTVDFNQPYAGKTLIYKVIVRRKLDNPIDKIKALIEWRLKNAPIDEFDISIKNKKLTITMPESVYLVDGIQYVKRGIARDVYKYLSDEVSAISFVENYPRESLLTSAS